jgi:hypothetical protein
LIKHQVPITTIEVADEARRKRILNQLPDKEYEAKIEEFEEQDLKRSKLSEQF